jgi:hypothetical protein
MAQSGFTPISTYYTTTASATPTAGNLVNGELAINITDGKLFYKDNAGVVQVIAGKGGAGVAGGSTTQVQYNSSGSLAGSANMTFSGTALTLANDASISGLTVGKGGGAVTFNAVFGASSIPSGATGAYNTAIGGTNALAALTTGQYNTAVGSFALASNTTQFYNVGVGHQAGYSNTTGGVTAVGTQVLYANTTGANNVGMGGSDGNGAIPALRYNTTGSANTAIGGSALGNNTTAEYNTAVGYSAGSSVTTGGTNVFLGRLAGSNTTTGFSNTYIGNNAQGSAVGNNNEIVIGNSATGKGSNTGYIYPNGGGVYQGNNSSTWSTTSDRRLKKNIVDNNTGLEKLTQIQVRNFEYRLPEEVTDLPQEQSIAKEGLQLGVIAQELAQVLPDCVKTETTGVMSVDTDNLTWYLINAVKELKAEIDLLKGK